MKVIINQKLKVRNKLIKYLMQSMIIKKMQNKRYIENYKNYIYIYIYNEVNLIDLP